MKNSLIDLDLFTIAIPDIPDVVFEHVEGENENAAFFRVTGVKKDDVLTINVHDKGVTQQGLLVEYSDSGAILKGEAASECSFTHKVERDEESVAFDIWPKKVSESDSIEDLHRTVVLIFNIQ